jgi:hypothetical protein
LQLPFDGSGYPGKEHSSLTYKPVPIGKSCAPKIIPKLYPLPMCTAVVMKAVSGDDPFIYSNPSVNEGEFNNTRHAEINEFK